LPFAAMVLVWPSVACASFNGPLHLSFGANVVIGVIAALPGAIAVLLLEWKGATWTPPSWAGALAALAFGYCLLRLTGLVGPAGDRGRGLLAIPPLIELALITVVRSSRARQAAGWAVAAASVVLLGLAQTSNALGPPGRPNEGWGLLCGGVLATALLWRVGVWLGQRTLRRLHG
jgi:hypothetical protein